jgi:polyisoprenoid-binding protein YceI
MIITRFTTELVIALFALTVGTALAQTQAIEPGRSTITVLVFKSGLFSAFADNHQIRAPISSGSFDETGERVEVVVDARKLVALDPKLPASKRQEVQERMLGPEVLDANQFPEIRFQSKTVEKQTANRFLVTGSLSLHGKTRPVSLQVAGSSGHYRGTATLRQRDFGITPISIAGGTVKVKDELKIEFDITGASPSPR